MAGIAVLFHSVYIVEGLNHNLLCENYVPDLRTLLGDIVWNFIVE